MNDDIRKWRPIIEVNLPEVKNKILIEIICQYAEWLSIKTDLPENTVSKELIRLKEDLKKVKRFKKEPQEYFNPVSMSIEYKLSNGKYVNSLNESYKLSNKFLGEIFNLEFLTEKYPEISRDLKIKKVTNV